MASTVVPTTENEQQRLASLRATGLLDTPREASFDRIVRLVADLLEVPIAAIALVDADRQWFKASKGLDLQQTERDFAFCAHTILGEEPLVVTDASADHRFADNPLVLGQPGIRFYAGVPLRTTNGLNLGALCAIDRRPRELSPTQVEILETLAAVAMDLIEAKRAQERAQIAETRLVDAVEAIPHAFVLFDKEDRLSLFNRHYGEFYPESSPVLQIGKTFEEIIRYGASLGQYPAAVGREEEWIQERLARHRSPGAPIEQEITGNRWLRIEERRTRDGGLVGFRVDITQLKRQQQELERLASIDSLTGVLNRRRFLEMAEAESERVRRTHQPAAILLVDIDHFKRVNDRYGHAAGDAVLVEVARTLRASIREYDQVGRLGGEEFAVLLPVIDLEAAMRAAERIRARVESLQVDYGEHRIAVTLSIGLTALAEEGDTPATALARADGALYLVKREGRNRVALGQLGSEPRLLDRVAEMVQPAG